jgi:hypothetical protein
MTAPGGSFGESGRDDPTAFIPAGERAPEQPAWQPPWVAPAGNYPPPPALDYPPDPPPGYPPAYPPGYSPGYPPPIPPTGYAQPGYQQPSGYGAPAYPPMPAPYGAPPGGYGPPSYPGGYYPGPDYLGGYGAIQPGMNTMAMTSLISSLVGVACCIGSIVAIVLGTMALNEIKRTREDGYGLAVAGIVIGIATLVVYLILVIFSAH